jgi:hypothetical protein
MTKHKDAIDEWHVPTQWQLVALASAALLAGATTMHVVLAAVTQHERPTTIEHQTIVIERWTMKD